MQARSFATFALTAAALLTLSACAPGEGGSGLPTGTDATGQNGGFVNPQGGSQSGGFVGNQNTGQNGGFGNPNDGFAGDQSTGQNAGLGTQDAGFGGTQTGEQGGGFNGGQGGGQASGFGGGQAAGAAHDIDGLWMSDCFKDSDGDPVRHIQYFSGTDYTSINTVFRDASSCGTPLFELRLNGTFSVSGQQVVSTGETADQIDQTVERVEMQVLDATAATNLNGNAFCDFTRWEINEIYDVGACDAFAGAPKAAFDLVYRVDNLLYMGDGSGDGSSSQNRPMDIDFDRPFGNIAAN